MPLFGREKTEREMQQPEPGATARLLAGPGERPVGALRMDADQGRLPIGEKEIARAAQLLTQYKDGKPCWRSGWWRTSCGGSCATGR